MRDFGLNLIFVLTITLIEANLLYNYSQLLRAPPKNYMLQTS
jgi:hypothetical protein